MERFFILPLFLYMLSLLLAVAGGRTELRYAHLASKISYALAAFGTAAILAARLRAQGSWQPTHFFDGVLFTLCILAVAYGAVRLFIRIRWASAILSAVSLGLGIMALFRVREASGAGAEAALEGLLKGHVICMFAALAAFTLSFIFSVLFLIQERMIKQRALAAHLSTLPPLELTARLNFAALTVGTAALAMGMVGGAKVMGALDRPMEALGDPTVALSLLMLALYGFLVWMRFGARGRSRTVAAVSAAFYLLMLFVFWGAHAGA